LLCRAVPTTVPPPAAASPLDAEFPTPRPNPYPLPPARDTLQRLQVAESAAVAGAARADALQREASGAAERARGLEDQLLCSICMERPRDSLLLPCCHFVACSVCVERMSQGSSGGANGDGAGGSGGGGRPQRSSSGGGGGGGATQRRCPVCRGCVHGQVVVHLAAAAAADAAAGPPAPAG
jgi:hypothetical protein